ncbi:MAG: hypothetical protein D3914_00340 [Candidatus Electrothrix sp. LOE2]|nr:hypothetical protein [Candidatus Electrothrix sp. LOE2]
MLPEYDFSGKKGVRGKYSATYQQGHTVQIKLENGSIATQYVTLEDGACIADSRIFPTRKALAKPYLA